MVAGQSNKEGGTIDKQDASSPTTALEDVLVLAVIDAKERRKVAVIDIPNAFIQNQFEDEEDKAVMIIRRKLAKLMVKVTPEIYTKYAIINAKGKTILYVRLLSALCGRHHESGSPLLPALRYQLEIHWFPNQPL
jgi:hypothetical protein